MKSATVAAAKRILASSVTDVEGLKLGIQKLYPGVKIHYDPNFSKTGGYLVVGKKASKKDRDKLMALAEKYNAKWDGWDEDGYPTFDTAK